MGAVCSLTVNPDGKFLSVASCYVVKILTSYKQARLERLKMRVHISEFRYGISFIGQLLQEPRCQEQTYKKMHGWPQHRQHLNSDSVHWSRRKTYPMWTGSRTWFAVTLSCWAVPSVSDTTRLLSSCAAGSWTGIFVPEGAWAGGTDDGTAEYLHLEICCPPTWNGDRGRVRLSLWRYVSHREWPMCFLFHVWVHLRVLSCCSFIIFLM